MKKLYLITTYIDCYIYLLPIRLLDMHNLIKIYLSFYSKKRYVNNTLNFLCNITLGLILCCPFLFSLIFATLSIDTLNIVDNYFILMEGNSGDYSGGQPGNSFGGPGGSSGGPLDGPSGPSGENNNLASLSSSNNSENRNENQQVNFTEELQDQRLKECMAGKLDRYRIANAHLRNIYLDDSFTSAEHEYIAEKIFQDRAVKALMYGPNRANYYAKYVVGPYPERRYLGRVTPGFISSVFL